MPTYAQFARLKAAAQAAGIERIVSFGERDGADARLVKVSLQAETSTVQAQHSRPRRDLQARRAGPARGRQFARRARGGASARRRSGARGARARRAQSAGRARRARDARCARRRGAADRRELQREPDLDARGARAARAGADARASAGASRCSATCSSLARTARSCMRRSPTQCWRMRSIWCICAGPLMKSLWDALPSERRGGYAETSAALEAGGSRRDHRGRCRDGQGFARLAHGADRQGAQAPLRAGRTGAQG